MPTSPEFSDREPGSARDERIAQIVDRAAQRLVAVGWIDIDSFLEEAPEEMVEELRGLLLVLVDVRNRSRLPFPQLGARDRDP